MCLTRVPESSWTSLSSVPAASTNPHERNTVMQPVTSRHATHSRRVGCALTRPVVAWAISRCEKEVGAGLGDADAVGPGLRASSACRGGELDRT